MSRFLAVCLNPTFQRTVSLQQLDTGEVNRASEARMDAAGKGIHVARVISQLGGEVVHLTHLGPGSEDFIRLCEADSLDVQWAESDSPIRTCITLLDRSSNSTTEIIEPTEAVDDATIRKIRELYREELKKVDQVVISGSKAPGYPRNFFAEFCRDASEAGVPVLIDYRGEELVASLPFKPAVVKINLVEFCATFLPDISVSEADDTAALPAVEARLVELSGDGIDWVITRGARDIYCAAAGVITTVEPKKITPVNTIGSGDSVAAGMAYALSEGADLPTAVAEGARCGGLNALCLKPGTIVCD